MVSKDNNPLAHVKESKFGAAQICWLSELTLFDFDIKYQSGKTNLAAYTLSNHPYNPDSELEEDDKDHEYKTISYPMVCQLLGEELSGLKLDWELTLKNQGGRNKKLQCEDNIQGSEGAWQHHTGQNEERTNGA